MSPPRSWHHQRNRKARVAVIDVAGFVADLKSQAIDHGFHVHDERHFVETYSLRQLWEVDLHPEEACSGPIDLHLSLDVDPRALLGFEDEIIKERYRVFKKFLPKGADAIEVGPGGGHVLKWLEGHGHRAVGVQYSQSLAQQLSARLSTPIINAEFETHVATLPLTPSVRSM